MTISVLHPRFRPARPLGALLAAALVLTGAGIGAAQEPPEPEPTTTIVDPPPTTTTTAPIPEGQIGTLPTLPPDALGDPLDPGEPPADPGPPPLDPSPQIRVLMARIGVVDSERNLTEWQMRTDAARVALDDARSRLDQADQAARDAETGFDSAEHALSDMAVASFMYAGGATPEAGAELSIYQQRKDQQLTAAVLEHKVTIVTNARDRLVAAEADRDQQRLAVEQATAGLAETESSLDGAGAFLDEARRELQRANAEDGPVLFVRDNPETWQLEIMGPSVLTPEEITAWFALFGGRSRASAPVDELARLFVEEGATEGMRGDVAFAQAVLETGGFTNDDTVRFNNYAGIGHCDSCPSGFHFTTPQNGVRGQIQLLKSYVFATPTYEHPLVDKRLRGPAECCQTWNELTGVWASAPGYGPIVLGVYQTMLEFALTVRAAAPPAP